LIDSITRAFEVFRTPNTILKDTPIAERPKSRLVSLAELVNTTCEWLADTTCEQPIPDIVASVKQVVLGDWFQGKNLVFKGGVMLTWFFSMYIIIGLTNQ
jgi:hypothetical protein